MKTSSSAVDRRLDSPQVSDRVGAPRDLERPTAVAGWWSRVLWSIAALASCLIGDPKAHAWTPVLTAMNPATAQSGQSILLNELNISIKCGTLPASSSFAPHVYFGTVDLGPAGKFSGGSLECGFTNLAVYLPASVIAAALPPGSSIATIPVTIDVNSNPLPFTIVDSTVNLKSVSTQTFLPGASGVLETIDYNTGAAVSATLAVDPSSSGSVTLTVAAYSQNPVSPGLLFDAGAGWFDLYIPSAGANDTVVATFFYPNSITGGLNVGTPEGDLTLQYYDPINPTGGGFHDVKNSDGSAPTRNTTDGPVYNPYGGYFTVTLDANSTPKITELSGTIFTMAPNPLVASPATLWPANGKLVPVTINAPGWTIVSVTSNEPVGHGKKAPDWEITGPRTLKLRAEREGKGEGRIYTILLQSSDGTQNIAVVRVPHDKR